LKSSIIAQPVRIPWRTLAFMAGVALTQFVPVSSTIRSIAFFSLLVAAAVAGYRWWKRQEPRDPRCV
jgi:membrane protein implicated in regulation of membrane protease activity